MADDVDLDDFHDVEIIPQFSLTVYDQPGRQVELQVALPTNPDDRDAPMALIYGMALLSLDQDGTIQNRMLDLIKVNPTITQKAACDNIRLLLMESLNDTLV